MSAKNAAAAGPRLPDADEVGIAPGEPDFQPIITSIADTYGSQAALTWPNGVKANETITRG